MRKLPIVLSVSLAVGSCLFIADATYAKPEPKPEKKIEQPKKNPGPPPPKAPAPPPKKAPGPPPPPPPPPPKKAPGPPPPPPPPPPKKAPGPPPPPPPPPGPPPHVREQQRLREDARVVIERTTFVLREAQHVAKRYHYTSGMAKAVAHQQKAHDLYRHGNYREAIFHSLRARDLAFQIIRGNRQSYHKDYYWNDMEMRYRKDYPKDKDLDVRIELRSRSDKEMLLIKLIFDLD